MTNPAQDPPHRFWTRWMVPLVLPAVLLAACSEGEPGEGADSEHRTPASEQADAAAPSTPSELLSAGLPSTDPALQLDVALSLAYIDRKFSEVADTEWTSTLIDQAMESARSDSKLRDVLPVARLIDDGVAPPEQAADSGSGERAPDEELTRAMVDSIWCDHLGEGPSVEELREIAGNGSYSLTHAFAAVVLLEENGCGQVDARAGLLDELDDRMAALVDKGDAYDLELQACAMLYWAGRGDLVDEGFADTVRAAQLDDGGWRASDRAVTSDPHATVWGLRCQLEMAHSGDVEPVRWTRG